MLKVNQKGLNSSKNILNPAKVDKQYETIRNTLKQTSLPPLLTAQLRQVPLQGEKNEKEEQGSGKSCVPLQMQEINVSALCLQLCHVWLN